MNNEPTIAFTPSEWKDFCTAMGRLAARVPMVSLPWANCRESVNSRLEKKLTTEVIKSSEIPEGMALSPSPFILKAAEILEDYANCPDANPRFMPSYDELVSVAAELRKLAEKGL